MTAIGTEGAPAPLIVVIDDEAMVLAGYQELLESFGYRVAAAGSAEEALAVLHGSGEQPAFVVADYRLGEGATGTDAIRFLQDSFGRPLPGVVITGDSAIARLRHAGETGFPVLAKPINGRQLLDILRRSLGT